MQSTRYVPPSVGDPLEGAVARHLAGNGTVDDVMRAYYDSTRVKRLIAHACYQYRVSPDFAEEITQELALLLIEKFLDKIEDADRIYNVLHRSACFMARRKRDKAGEDSLEDLIERSDDFDPTGSALLTDNKTLEDQIAIRIDHQKAVDDFNRRLALAKENPMFATPTLRMDLSLRSTKPQVVSAASVVPRPAPPKPAQKPVATPKVVSPEGEELNKIRKSLGYTVPEFAQVLNISKGTLSSYLYGIVQNIPSETISEARSLISQGGTKFQALAEKFASMTMRDIVVSWLVELGLELGEDNDIRAHAKVLGDALDVDRATIWRWTERDMRPDMRALQDYQERIQIAKAKAALAARKQKRQAA